MSIPLALLNELMGMTPNASEHGLLIQHMLEFCHWFMLALFVGWMAFFLYTIFRFHRSRNPRANYHGVKTKASAHLEFAVVLIEAVLLLGFALPLWGRRVTEFPDKDQALRVRAIGEQFWWNFHYPGPDNTFGRQSISLVSGANPLGIDWEDPAAQDDIVSKNELYLVNHRPTVIDIGSKDVIHSLSLHHFRMDQDATPGFSVPMWFRPIRAGEYEIVCAQLCGAGHYSMKAISTVTDQKGFDEWRADILTRMPPAQKAAAAPAGAPGAPSAATPPAAPAEIPASAGTPAPR
jgi:cytochrome c oxidase subunit II